MKPTAVSGIWIKVSFPGPILLFLTESLTSGPCVLNSRYTLSRAVSEEGMRVSEGVNVSEGA